MNDANMPQCMSTLRLHQMLLDGEHEKRALETTRRLRGKYRGLRSCDKAFNAIVNMGKPNGDKVDVTDTDATSQKPPQLLYAEYVDCVSGVLCRELLVEWGACISAVQKQQREIGHCAQAKRMLERCLRSKTEELLKASQPQVFRPSAAP